MKKRFLFLCCLCLAVVLVGCQKDDSLPINVDNNEAREAAWDLLSAEARESVTHSWEDARVQVGKFSFLVSPLENPRFEKHYCYRVTFSAADDPFIFSIYLDVSTLEYLGTDVHF